MGTRNQASGLNLGPPGWEYGGSFQKAWGRQGLASLLRGNLLSLGDVARLSSPTPGVMHGLLTLRSDGEVVWHSRDPATH